ncbi:peptidoglycan-binding protein [Streptomyces sp. NBC_01171]|uniref:peptidoglycan-binding protein n=1 Tax=Streptomyces sp. NBC_01171 TaxID=2903757 RepID=UPI003862E7C6|nr:peptidoglycan-binding protein [Streptomyces sp. NBC_01171]
MPTPPDPERPRPARVVEPVRVLRARPTDALAELMRELMPEPGEGARTKPPADAEDDTEELPPVPAEDAAPPRSRRRRWAVAAALAAAALVGFGCALLLPGRQESTARPAPPPVPTTMAPSAPSKADPDGPGTLRQGDSGPEVTELRRRLLRIPDVFHDGSATGPYDARLAAAVARFQLWYGIRGDETGVYGDDTRRDLESRTG